jgi:peptide/nickel transport system substrate-binding protein
MDGLHGRYPGRDDCDRLQSTNDAHDATGQTSTSTATTPSTTPSTTTTTSTATQPASSNEPQYGGTITFDFPDSTITSYFDPMVSSVGGWTLSICYDKLVSADWAKGPAGSNEWPFLVANMPAQYRSGVLAERWEVKSTTQLIFHLRQGVRFQNKKPANGKELTSADVIYTYQRGQKDPRFTEYGFVDWTDTAGVDKWKAAQKAGGRTDAEIAAWIDKLKGFNYPFLANRYEIVIDKYTVEYGLLNPYSDIIETGSWQWVSSSDSKGLDMNDWKNQSSTGPWIVQDCVPGSSVTWVKNPDYFMKDPVHPQNQLPYADTLKSIVIPDLSTWLAALRTHKDDLHHFVPWDKAADLKKTNPELQMAQESPIGARLIFMRTDIAPFNDVRVRQALAMAIDRDTIISGYYKGNAIPDAWPCLPGNVSGFTPISQMPADVKQLYEYHPDLSKQLLAAAGYATGFKGEVLIWEDQTEQALLQLVVEQWKKINVEATIKVVQGPTHTAYIYGENYPSMIYSFWSNVSPQAAMGWAHGGVDASIYAFSKVHDQLAVDAFNKWAATTDPVEASKIMKAEYLREDKLVWEVPLPTPVDQVVWQPYLKGYHGETGMGLTPEMGTTELYKFLWIDKTLRQQITGSK